MTNHPNRNRIPPEKWPAYLQRFRTRHNMSQPELALKLCNLSVRTLQQWESGRRVPPDYLKLALRLIAVETKLAAKGENSGPNYRE